MNCRNERKGLRADVALIGEYPVLRGGGDPGAPPPECGCFRSGGVGVSFHCVGSEAASIASLMGGHSDQHILG